jgi:hypothetical protein
MALLLSLDEDHGMVAEGAADQSGQERQLLTITKN